MALCIPHQSTTTRGLEMSHVPFGVGRVNTLDLPQKLVLCFLSRFLECKFTSGRDFHLQSSIKRLAHGVLCHTLLGSCRSTHFPAPTAGAPQALPPWAKLVWQRQLWKLNLFAGASLTSLPWVSELDSVSQTPGGFCFNLQPCLKSQLVFWLEDTFLGLPPPGDKPLSKSKPLSWFLLYSWWEILTTVPESSACVPVHHILPSKQVLIYLASCLPESALTLEARNYFQSCAEGFSRKSHSSGVGASTRHSGFLSFRWKLCLILLSLKSCLGASGKGGGLGF